MKNQGLNEFGNLFEALLYYFVFFAPSWTLATNEFLKAKERS